MTSYNTILDSKSDQFALNITDTYSIKRRFDSFAKSIDPGQPVHSPQADLGPYSSDIGQFSAYQRTSLSIHYVLCSTKFHGSMMVV